jgi:hypothetical protein
MTPQEWIIFILNVSPAILALIKAIESMFTAPKSGPAKLALLQKIVRIASGKLASAELDAAVAEMATDSVASMNASGEFKHAA